jgi:peptidoglycan/LPS O-acetylase OafA/YrhL
MVNLPRDISPGTAARRSLLADLIAAIGLAFLTLQLAAGIGIVGVLALVTIAAIVLWIVLEAAVRRLRRRGREPRRERHAEQ